MTEQDSGENAIDGRLQSLAFTDISTPEKISSQEDLKQVAERHAGWISRTLDPGCEKMGGRANFQGCHLAGLDFRGFDLRCAGFVNACLDNAILADARLGGCNFSGASLRGADFRGSHLRKAVFLGSDISGAIFDDDVDPDICGQAAGTPSL